MKKVALLVLTILSCCLSACFDINEDITINENGSGRFASRMDMSGLIEMMQSMGAEDELAKEGMDRPIDTVIFMKDVLDSAKSLTATQREVMKDGQMHLVMNLADKVFRADMTFPFDNYEALQLLMSGGGNGGMAGVFKNVFNSGKEASGDSVQQADESPGDLNTVYDVKVENGLISRIVNQARLDSLLAKPDMAQMKGMAGSGLEMLYTTTISFPRPVKSSDNDLVKLSEDKKTATISYNMLDILSTPEKFSYTIKY